MAKVGSAVVVFWLITQRGNHLSPNRLYVDTFDLRRQCRINVFRPTRNDLSSVCICRCGWATVARSIRRSDGGPFRMRRESTIHAYPRGRTAVCIPRRSSRRLDHRRRQTGDIFFSRSQRMAVVDGGTRRVPARRRRWTQQQQAAAAKFSHAVSPTNR